MITCMICSKEMANNKGLSYHCSTVHGIKFVDYVLRFEHSGIWPLCACGCKEGVRFLGGKFMTFLNGHFFRGRDKSQETKDKISKTQTGRKLPPEWKEKIRQTTKKNYDEGRGNIEKMMLSVRGRKQTDEHRQKLSQTRSARIASGEIVINREKISETMTQKYLDEGFRWAKGHHDSPKTGKKHYYRSSWELRHMQELDVDGSVVSYDSEPFSVPYLWEGFEKRYIPDFVVRYADGHTELHEIGVKKLKDSPRNSAKCAAAREHCLRMGWTFRVISF